MYILKKGSKVTVTDRVDYSTVGVETLFSGFLESKGAKMSKAEIKKKIIIDLLTNSSILLQEEETIFTYAGLLKELHTDLFSIGILYQAFKAKGKVFVDGLGKYDGEYTTEEYEKTFGHKLRNQTFYEFVKYLSEYHNDLAKIGKESESVYLKRLEEFFIHMETEMELRAEI